MKAGNWLLRAALGLASKTFPEDIRGIHRSDIEATLLDKYRAVGRGNSGTGPGLPEPGSGAAGLILRVTFLLREALSLAWNGAMERMDGWKESSAGERQGWGQGVGGPASGGGGGDGGGSRGPGFVQSLRDDLRLALKKLRKSPGFSAAVVLTLAVGIGATVAMFSVLEAALFRSLPYPEPEELVLGRATFQGEMNMTCSFPDYLDHRDGSDAFEVMAAILPGARSVTITGRDTPERAALQWVTTDFFQALDVAPTLGRSFFPEEGEPNAPDVAIISHGFWQRWFGGDPGVVGETLVVEGFQTTVVGVMPAGFRFRNDTDLWASVRMGLMDTEGRRSHSWQIVGRLKDEVTLEQAQAQMDVISAQLAEAYPDSHTGKGMGFVRLGEGLAEDYRPALLLLMGATALLLLIACGNVAGLLIARATARKVELSVRAALGASRRILARQLFVESLVLAGLAGVGGCFLALWLQDVTLNVFPLDLLGVTDAGLSGPMLSFALVTSLGTALLFGAGPALTASQANPAEDLKGGRRATSSGRGGRFRGGLVMAQVAFSVILLTGSGLLIRSFVQLQRVELGFETENLITAGLSIAGAEYQEPTSRTQFFQGVLDDVRAMPGVRFASFIDMVPILHRYRNWFVWDTNNPPEGEESSVSTFSRTVLPGYFETVGIPILRGRDHDPQDAARDEPYLIISESAAQQIFPGEDPIGRQVTVFNGMRDSNYEVLGVVGDIRMTRVGRDPSPQMYFSHPTMASTSMNLVIRAQGDPAALMSSIRRAVLDRDPDVPLASISTMKDIVSGSISQTRVLSLATALFAFTALFLSMTGLYAVLAYYVVSRTQEIGIRVAFGATGGRILRMVLKRGLVLVAAGLIFGLVGAAASTRVLQSQLYEVGTMDPLTFGVVALGFVLVGIFAALVPAGRASRLDPVRAIQEE